MLVERLVERCASCRSERPRASETPCRCTAPQWQRFCTRCVKVVAEDMCPHCLSIATTNGGKLRVVLDARFAKVRGLSGALEAHARLHTRVVTVLREFGIDTAAPALPDWAKSLALPSSPLPPGADHSRSKMAAISDLRLESASVELALKALGPYLGRPVEDKLALKLKEGDEAEAFLRAWDFIAADSMHERALTTAAETLAGSDQHAVTLLDSIMKRNLSSLVAAVVRRDRAASLCSRALGIH